MQKKNLKQQQHDIGMISACLLSKYRHLQILTDTSPPNVSHSSLRFIADPENNAWLLVYWWTGVLAAACRCFLGSRKVFVKPRLKKQFGPKLLRRNTTQNSKKKKKRRNRRRSSVRTFFFSLCDLIKLTFKPSETITGAAKHGRVM